MRTYPSIGIGVGQVLLPADGVDPALWAVVACDQYTSQPEYWKATEALVGDAPSTLRIIYPEVYLEHGEDDEAARIANIQAAMQRYLEAETLAAHNGIVFVERRIGEHTRRGLVLCVDLEAYDFSADSTSLIRATEGTIVERLPPRIKVRRGAPLESPHILVLLDDPEDRVIGAVSANREHLTPLYDIELMQGGGHLSGHLVDAKGEAAVVAGLERLADPDRYAKRYGLPEGTPVLLFAMGDGNHSLATAKAIWDEYRDGAEDRDAVMQSPLRYALVELVNVHDPALEFEPIHRVLFKTSSEAWMDALGETFGADFSSTDYTDLEALIAAVDAPGETHRMALIHADGMALLSVANPAHNLAVGTFQGVIDSFLEAGGAGSIDYVHGRETVVELGRRPGNVGLYLPGMSKHELFRTVILDGPVPRKTFSLGEAHEKRYYMECRKLGS